MRTVLAIVAGFGLLLLGLAVLIPLPEIGLPALAVGLRLLGRRYAWARAANNRLDEAVRSWRRRWSHLPRAARIAILILLPACVALVVYLLVT